MNTRVIIAERKYPNTTISEMRPFPAMAFVAEYKRHSPTAPSSTFYLIAVDSDTKKDIMTYIPPEITKFSEAIEWVKKLVLSNTAEVAV